jgi:hypothetical protein
MISGSMSSGSLGGGSMSSSSVRSGSMSSDSGDQRLDDQQFGEQRLRRRVCAKAAPRRKDLTSVRHSPRRTRGGRAAANTW